MNQQLELTDDDDFIVDVPTLHSWMTIDSVYAVRRNPLIQMTVEIERQAHAAGILGEDDETND